MWRITIETLETGITSPRLPTLADIEQRTEDLLAHRLSRHATSAADLASPPTAALPTSGPLRPPKEPQHSPRSVFDEYALYGLAGEAVRALAPHTGAQPEAILLQLLAAFGNLIGPSPHCMVGPTRHALNLFVVLVGESSRARKGTRFARLFAEADPAWTENRVTSARLTTRGQAALALWDYCSYSAGSLFGSCAGDSVADRILKALQAADNGLTRKQIRDLFHGHLGSGSINQALEKLRSLGVATFRYVPGRGPFTTLWSATDYQDPEPTGEETPEPEEFLWDET